MTKLCFIRNFAEGSQVFMSLFIQMKKIKVLVEPISMLNLSPNVNKNIDLLNMLGNCPDSGK